MIAGSAQEKEVSSRGKKWNRGSKKAADKAVCTDSKCIQVQYVHGYARSTDTIYVHVHSNHVQTRNGFSGMAQ